MIHQRNSLVCLTLFLGLSLVLSNPSACSAEPEPEYGFEVGKSMKFHVVDFVGPGPRGGGCPSVMISNSRKVGLEIWSRTSDDSAFQLAAALQGVLPASDRPNAFLLLFDKPTPEAVAAQSEKLGLKSCYVTTPRNSAKALINSADPEEKFSTLVFVEDRKVIKAVWRFEQGMLNDKEIQRVVNETRELVPDKP